MYQGGWYVLKKKSSQKPLHPISTIWGLSFAAYYHNREKSSFKTEFTHHTIMTEFLLTFGEWYLSV